MDTARWHRDTTLMALATSLDRMLATDYRLSTKSHSAHNSSLRKSRSQITTGAIERQRTATASFETSRHRST